MIRLDVAGRQLEGSPLAWNEDIIHLLGRDGRLWQFDPAQASDFRRTSGRFQPYSVSELRADLLRELGGEYEVSGTGHYLVAHPRHQGEKWAQRFEDLYRFFVHYFSVRGLKLSPPAFPLVGIVCRNRQEFQQYSATNIGSSMPGMLGFYALQSNRIVLYDMGRRERSAAWQQNAAVIIHEATHQTAFNTGIHCRYAPPPLWLAEGLATMFEADGVHNSQDYPEQSRRINRERLNDFRRLSSRHRPELLMALVSSDALFRSSPDAAYAEAWALTFYFMENESQKFGKYLGLTGRRAPFTVSSAEERQRDFVAAFGSDWRMLEARLLRFMAGLK
jgi:hypothetical protein